jgi:hypothetical protein
LRVVEEKGLHEHERGDSADARAVAAVSSFVHGARSTLDALHAKSDAAFGGFRALAAYLVRLA